MSEHVQNHVAEALNETGKALPLVDCRNAATKRPDKYYQA